MALLNNVDWQRTAARPTGGAHSIWEIGFYIAAWTDAARRRVSGEVVELTPQRNSRSSPIPGDESRRYSVRTLVRRQETLASLTAALTDEQLDVICPGMDCSA